MRLPSGRVFGKRRRSDCKQLINQLCVHLFVNTDPSSALLQVVDGYTRKLTCLSNRQALQKRSRASFCVDLDQFRFPLFLAGDRENVAEASAVMLSCLQWLHHPSGNRSQLGVSSQSAQMLNGMTGCVQALRPRPNRRWLLDGDTRQPQDTRWTRHSEQLFTPAEAAASDAAGRLKRGLRWMTPWRTASRR